MHCSGTGAIADSQLRPFFVSAKRGSHKGFALSYRRKTLRRQYLSSYCMKGTPLSREYKHPRHPVVGFGSSQVPAEIIKELAPGLEFNAEGAPVMPNVGEGMMPNLPGFPAGGPDGQQCCIS